MNLNLAYKTLCNLPPTYSNDIILCNSLSLTDLLKPLWTSQLFEPLKLILTSGLA